MKKYFGVPKIILLFLVIQFSNCFYLELEKKDNPKVIEGKIDLSNWDFKDQKFVRLNGDWEFFWEKFIDTLQVDSTEKDYIKIPSRWYNPIQLSKSYPSTGFATYKISVKLLKGTENLGLNVRDIPSAYNLYWNGILVSSNGKIANNEKEIISEYSPRIIPIKDIRTDNTLIIHSANFHDTSGGILESIKLGRYEDLQRLREIGLIIKTFIIGALFIMGLYHISLYSSKINVNGISFGCFCISMAFSLLFLEERPIVYLFPELSWTTTKRMEYFFPFSAAPSLLVFFYTLFPKEFNRKIVYILFGYFVFTLAITLITPLSIYSKFSLPFQFISIITASYIFYVILKYLIKGNMSGIIGAIGFLFFFISVIHDIFLDNLFINHYHIVPLGLMLFIISYAFMLSIRLTKTFKSIERLSKNLRISNRTLFKLKNELEDKIEKRTFELLKEQSRMEMIGQMTSEIVHDLKNPITSILCYAELADSDEIGRPVRSDYLKIIGLEAIRLSDMSHDILDFVKGRVNLHKTRVNASKYFEDIIAFILPELKDKNIELETKFNYEGEVIIDSERMRRAILNITSNAIQVLQFDKKPEHRICLSLDFSDGKVIFSIEDNGTGIPETIRSKIFKPFVTHGKADGTGLGMAVVKGIVDAHEGTITFETIDGLRTKFIISVPGISE